MLLLYLIAVSCARWNNRFPGMCWVWHLVDARLLTLSILRFHRSGKVRWGISRFSFLLLLSCTECFEDEDAKFGVLQGLLQTIAKNTENMNASSLAYITHHYHVGMVS